jgi:Trypsin-like peptidase domain
VRSQPLELIVSIPKQAKVPALASFTVSVGLLNKNGLIATMPGTTQPLPHMAGSAIAIDPYHLLTSAHVLEFNLGHAKVDVHRLQYRYASLFVRSNFPRIRVLHDHSGNSISRGTMYQVQSGGYDCEIVAYCDGYDPKVVRTTSSSPIPLEKDLVLLYSPQPLPCKDFPLPSRGHAPPYDNPSNVTLQKVFLLSYNGTPNLAEEVTHYPHTPLKTLETALDKLYPEALSFAQGSTAANRWERDTIFHRISTHCGSSGGGLFNSNGELIGSAPYFVLNK